MAFWIPHPPLRPVRALRGPGRFELPAGAWAIRALRGPGWFDPGGDRRGWVVQNKIRAPCGGLTVLFLIVPLSKVVGGESIKSPFREFQLGITNGVFKLPSLHCDVVRGGKGAVETGELKNTTVWSLVGILETVFDWLTPYYYAKWNNPKCNNFLISQHLIAITLCRKMGEF